MSSHYARNDGYRVVVVHDDIARSLRSVTDLNGEPMFDINRYHEEWNDSFTYDFVDPGQLGPGERAVFDLTGATAEAAGVDLLDENISVAVSETTRLSDEGAQVTGVWEPAERRIVVRRDQLRDAVTYCGTFLHELTHAVSGASDLTFEFEDALTTQLGAVAVAAVGREVPTEELEWLRPT